MFEAGHRSEASNVRSLLQFNSFLLAFLPRLSDVKQTSSGLNEIREEFQFASEREVKPKSSRNVEQLHMIRVIVCFCRA